MKTIALLSFWLLAALPLWGQANSGNPLPLSIRGRTATVTVGNSARQVVLEQRSGEGWKPLAVAHPTRSGKLSFSLPANASSSSLRAVSYNRSKFPARFRTAARRFDRAAPSANAMVLNDGAVGGNLMLSVSSGRLAANGAQGNGNAVAAQQSDIWQIRGERVFFFNQYRGLQVLELSDPMQPTRLGTLRLPASGEQMFVLDEAASQLALLGRSNDAANPGKAALWTVQLDAAGRPSLSGQILLNGSVLDSRLIGSTLHVLSVEWGGFANSPDGLVGTTSGAWGSRVLLTSLDLSNPAQPQSLGTLTWDGAQTAVLQDAGDCLLVATTGYGAGGEQRALRVLDLSGRAPVERKTLTPRGWVQDKFKIGRVGDSVVVISQDFSLGWQARQTWVETFPISGEATALQGSVEIVDARGESLYATRLDGDRLYAVTFLQVDPLFVIDLSNPAEPVVQGQLKIPGFSTYIEPLGDRLLCVGRENQQVAIKLFDVADAANPAVVSELLLGSEGGYSWSEANYDEKAVAWLPEQGLLMVPFQSGWGGNAQRAIQVVHVTAQGLQAGITLDHEFDPRRGSMIHGHLVSVSGQELKVQGADEANADHQFTLPLAWSVDRVVPVGEWLVQIEDGNLPTWNYWGPVLRMGIMARYAHAKVRVSSSADPDALTQQLDLGQGSVLASVQQSQQLLLALWVPAAADGSQGARLRTVRLDLSGTQPVISQAGVVEHDLGGSGAQSLRLDAVQGLLPAEGKLAWWIPSRTDFWGGYCIALAPQTAVISRTEVSNNAAGGNSSITNTVANIGPNTTAPAVLVDPGWSENPQRLVGLILPVTLTAEAMQAGQPQLLKSESAPLQVSAALSAAGFIFLSHDNSLSKEVVVQAATPMRGSVRGIFLPNLPAKRRLELRVESWLRVLDWRGEELIHRDPVSLPGQLIAVAQADDQGAVLLTQSDRQLGVKNVPIRELQASAYDGISAWLLSNYVTATGFFTATATDGQRLYVVRDAASGSGVDAVGYDAVGGRLARVGQWGTSAAPNLLAVVGNHLLASSFGNLEIAEIVAGPSAGAQLLQPRAAYDMPTNLWLRVDRAMLALNQGIWVPAGVYGVELLQAQPRQ